MKVSKHRRASCRARCVAGYLNLFNEALPARALMASEGRVELGDFRANSERMMWRFTDEGRPSNVLFYCI